MARERGTHRPEDVTASLRGTSLGVDLLPEDDVTGLTIRQNRPRKVGVDIRADWGVSPMVSGLRIRRLVTGVDTASVTSLVRPTSRRTEDP
jgi:hypothetical protein